MKVNIVGKGGGWILDKFGTCMTEELQKMGIEALFTREIDKGFNPDIVHYIGWNVGQVYDKNPTKTTFIITHVDTESKLDTIIERTNKGCVGICMSKETKDRMINSGVKANRVCYINPAQDGQIMPKKINLGFTHRIYGDNRKRETMLLDICKMIDPKIFKFSIMGSGWQFIVDEMVKMGFEVDYFEEFDKNKYNQLILGLDYYCYFGFDEGSMGFLDAVAAGVGTIVTPQGYHLDTECGITFPVETISDIVNVLKELENKWNKHFRFVKEWTWEKYTQKHVEIWKYMLGAEKLENLLQTRGWYKDGIYSLLLTDLEYQAPLKEALTSRIKK